MTTKTTEQPESPQVEKAQIVKGSIVKLTAKLVQTDSAERKLPDLRNGRHGKVSLAEDGVAVVDFDHQVAGPKNVARVRARVRIVPVAKLALVR